MENLSQLEINEKYIDFEQLVRAIIISNEKIKDKEVRIQLLIENFESLKLNLTNEQELRVVSLKKIVNNLVYFCTDWNRQMFDARKGIPIHQPKNMPLKIDDIID